MKNLFYVVVLLLSSATLMAQEFDLSAEIRPRFESRNGFGTLSTDSINASNFVSQRTRLNFDFKKGKINLRIKVQNIRVWGDVPTMSVDDNAISFQEAWAEAVLSDKISFKLGRQEISYDDERIFGSVNWAQQARSHDAFLMKFTPTDKHQIDVGLALNSDAITNEDNLYSNTAGYKTFQYLWYHGDFDKFGLSFLFLNNGVEYGDENLKQVVDYTQTIGPRLTYKEGKFDADASLYFQTGKLEDIKVNSLYYGGSVGYKITDEFKIAIGYEYLSGKDMNDTSTEITSFAPLYGTNHKFNGWMDYFYVGNHRNSVGLSDIYGTFSYKKGRFFAKITPHLFSAVGSVYNGTEKMDSKLGTEIDFAMGYKVAENISVKAGYSQMFATESMEILKGGDRNATNNWAWLTVTFNPNLYSSKPTK
ncbi:MAG: alginate export family protein [Flavobacteriaceae bacterium]|nr:alginate export family protein [Flavobacteriaceae bacterium]